MKTAGEYKSIVLITLSGRGQGIADRLFARGVRMVDLHFARGSLPGGPQTRKGVQIETQQDILTCVEESGKADDVFNLIYDLAEVGTQNGSFMYMHRTGKCSSIVLPEKNTPVNEL